MTVTVDQYANNAPEQQNKPYVLLIGVDGLRHDFPNRFGAVHLQAMRDAGSSAAALTPSFPSTTFPNFYSIATGLRPEHHGIVGMSFFDPRWNEEFHFRTTGTEGRWYDGTPIWVLAELQGMRTASYFWVGTEAVIQGTKPTFCKSYDARITPEEKVAEVLRWLHVPEAARPHLITLYLPEVDTAAHAFGPEAPEVRDAVLLVDQAIGSLMQLLQEVQPAVNVLVVADHGLQGCQTYLDLTPDADWTGLRIINELTHIMAYSPDLAVVDRVYHQLRLKSEGRYDVYRKQEIPARLHFQANVRIGDLLVMPLATDLVVIHSPAFDTTQPYKPLPGCHGFDPARPEMGGVFYAAGPHIRPGEHLPPVDNIEVFPLLTALLGLQQQAKLDATGLLVPKLYMASGRATPGSALVTDSGGRLPAPLA